MVYKEHTYNKRVTAWQMRFGEVAKMCSAKVKGLPKGEKLRAYRACMRDSLRKK
jgi:hypothetical protein